MKVFKNCEVCGEEYVTKPSHAARRRYCSRPCFEHAHKEGMSGENNPAYKHGASKRSGHTVEYNAWQHILSRCENESNKRWKRYGGRGIKVCERWHVFQNFLDDMGVRPPEMHSIERKDNDGDYCPENCVWATRETQARNKSSNVRVTYNGETLCLREWSRRLEIKYATLYMRLRNGWTVERAFQSEVRRW